MIIYGKQPVKELLRSKHHVDRIYIANEITEKKFFIQTAQKLNIKFQLLPKAHFQKYTGPVLHQGIAAEISQFQYYDESGLSELIKRDKNPFFVILDQIQDPHNVGAIIRTAEIAGITAIILPEKAQLKSMIQW